MFFLIASQKFDLATTYVVHVALAIYIPTHNWRLEEKIKS